MISIPCQWTRLAYPQEHSLPNSGKSHSITMPIQDWTKWGHEHPNWTIKEYRIWYDRATTQCLNGSPMVRVLYVPQWNLACSSKHVRSMVRTEKARRHLWSLSSGLPWHGTSTPPYAWHWPESTRPIQRRNSNAYMRVDAHKRPCQRSMPTTIITNNMQTTPPSRHRRRPIWTCQSHEWPDGQ